MPIRASPYFTSPHQVAGGPLAENILKCQLKPLDLADYTGITFTADTADAAGRRLPERRLRLDQAGRRPARCRRTADLYGGSRRRCAPGSARVRADLVRQATRPAAPVASRMSQPRAAACYTSSAAALSFVRPVRLDVQIATMRWRRRQSLRIDRRTIASRNALDDLLEQRSPVLRRAARRRTQWVVRPAGIEPATPAFGGLGSWPS